MDQTLTPQHTLVEIKNTKKDYIQKEIQSSVITSFDFYVSHNKPILMPVNLGTELVGLEELNKTIDDEQAA